MTHQRRPREPESSRKAARRLGRHGRHPPGSSLPGGRKVLVIRNEETDRRQRRKVPFVSLRRDGVVKPQKIPSPQDQDDEVRRVMASSSPGGQPHGRSRKECSHSEPRTTLGPARASKAARPKAAGSRDHDEQEAVPSHDRIGSPYRSRNPRKQRARPGGNASPSRRTRPAAQSLEAGRGQDEHSKREADGSQDLR
jgi:hypothetical protein